eukprot:TRINITY_DN430_c1_g1_i2.p1 TRINITY_DN430_c1_g1~~TRINITY_DN430_c1_g1_i2.p1  ORF type:complete len:942 (+),score=363.60 TRINITY_DN430_c1_g1_i2:272-3097(+)
MDDHDDSLSMSDDPDVGYVLGENLKTLSLALKSAEEIERLTLADGQFYNDLERAVYLLAPDRLTIQRLSVVNHLPVLLRDFRDDGAADKLLPKVLSALGSGGSGGGGGGKSGNSKDGAALVGEYQEAVGNTLARLIADKLVPVRLLAPLVVPRALHMLLQTALAQPSGPGATVAPAVGKNGGGGGAQQQAATVGSKLLAAWLATLFACIDACPPDAELLKDQLVPWATARGQVTEPTPCRLLGCRVLGRLATRLQAPTIETTFFSLAIALCQDTSHLVRACMCEQLLPIARAVGVETSTRVILTELQELLNDEQPDVIHAAFTCCVSLLEFFDADTVTETLVPLLRGFCRAAPAALGSGGSGGDETTQLVIADNFGRLLVLGADKLHDDDISEFCQMFSALCKAPSPRVRFQCAYNFPAVVKVAGEKRFNGQLQEAYAAFVADPSADVRHSIAASFAVLAELLGPRSGRLLRPLFVQLLRDVSPSVRQVLATSLDVALDYFARAGDDTAGGAAGASLLQPVLELQPALSGSWRLLTPFVEQLADFHKFFAAAQVIDKVLPVLLRLLSSNHMLPVKRAAIVSLCRLLRLSVRSVAKRREVCARLLAEFGPRGGRSAWQRQLFVEIAATLGAEFSRRFLREQHFTDAIIDLATDPVAVVRLKLVRFVPELRRLIRLPHDAALLKRLKMCTAALCNDSDRDVAQAAVVANHRLDAFPADGNVDDDDANRRKEEDEEALARLEERDADEARRREDEARSEFRRKLAEKEHEISMKAKIFGNKTRAPMPSGSGLLAGSSVVGSGGRLAGQQPFVGNGAFSVLGSAPDAKPAAVRRAGMLIGAKSAPSQASSQQPERTTGITMLAKQRSYKSDTSATPDAPSGTRAGPASARQQASSSKQTQHGASSAASSSSSSRSHAPTWDVLFCRGCMVTMNCKFVMFTKQNLY